MVWGITVSSPSPKRVVFIGVSFVKATDRSSAWTRFFQPRVTEYGFLRPRYGLEIRTRRPYQSVYSIIINATSKSHLLKDTCYKNLLYIVVRKGRVFVQNMRI